MLNKLISISEFLEIFAKITECASQISHPLIYQTPVVKYYFYH